MRFVAHLAEIAQSEILLIDPYSDAVTLDVVFSKKRSSVKVGRSVRTEDSRRRRNLRSATRMLNATSAEYMGKQSAPAANQTRLVPPREVLPEREPLLK